MRGGFNFVWGYRGDAYCKASLIVVPVGAVAPFWSGDNPLKGTCGLGPKLRARCLRASTSEVYSAGVALYLWFRF